MITVFTPTYNRASHLQGLYESLLAQSSFDFEWLIVDDGSTDGTAQVVASWLGNEVFAVRYVSQPNGGKHRAINRGVQEAHGELFFTVDSDDRLCADAIETILAKYRTVELDEMVCGVCGQRMYADGTRIGGELSVDETCCNSLDYKYRHKVKGDLAQVVRTSVMRAYPFPEIANERFCAESLVWNRMAQQYKFLFFTKCIYVGGYLEDGLTRNSVKGRMHSPQYATLMYKELTEMHVPIRVKIRSSINYWRFWFCLKNKVLDAKYLCVWGLCALPGLCLHIKDRCSQR